MRRFFTVLLSLAGLCHAKAGWTPGERAELGALPGEAVAWQREVTGPGGTVRVSGVSFSSQKAVFRVIDNHPDERVLYPDILSKAGAVAGINGGYFHPDYRPLGLVVSGGEEIHGFEKAKLLSGLVVVRGGKIEMVRSGAFKPGKEVREVLQSGPWLVEHGAAVADLNSEKKARRSAVMTDGKGHWAIVATGYLTLESLAQVLALPNLAGDWTARDALNLDGGSSTALWAATAKPLVIYSFGTVRNYLAIVPRQK